MTDGISYYCRLNAELTDSRAGFLYSRSTTDAGYRQIDTTDLSLYESGDSHIRWYELAAAADGPLWIEPYDSPIGNDQIISYEIPWRSADGTFIGVVGFDMSFSGLLRTLEDIVPYESGFAGLVSADGTQLYTTADGAVSVTAVVDSVREQLAEPAPETVGYVIIGNEPIYHTWETLSNGMRLLITVPGSSVDARCSRLILLILSAGLILLAVFLFVIVIFTGRITGPLRRLNEAARHLADGDTSLQLTARGQDEVAELTRSLGRMSERINTALKEANTRANRDGLTGVKNKAFYLEYVEQLQQRCKDGPCAYAVVMMDINYLKRVNDTYGHDAGDELILAAARLICVTFAHSPVFRVGGDEFCAILQNNDYEARDELMRQLRMGTGAVPGVPGGVLSIASGMSVHPADSSREYDEVFREADWSMYENKRRMKAGRM